MSDGRTRPTDAMRSAMSVGWGVTVQPSTKSASRRAAAAAASGDGPSGAGVTVRAAGAGADTRAVSAAVGGAAGVNRGAGAAADRPTGATPAGAEARRGRPLNGGDAGRDGGGEPPGEPPGEDRTDDGEEVRVDDGGRGAPTTGTGTGRGDGGRASRHASRSSTAAAGAHDSDEAAAAPATAAASWRWRPASLRSPQYVLIQSSTAQPGPSLDTPATPATMLTGRSESGVAASIGASPRKRGCVSVSLSCVASAAASAADSRKWRTARMTCVGEAARAWKALIWATTSARGTHAAAPWTTHRRSSAAAGVSLETRMSRKRAPATSCS